MRSLDHPLPHVRERGSKQLNSALSPGAECGLRNAPHVPPAEAAPILRPRGYVSSRRRGPTAGLSAFSPQLRETRRGRSFYSPRWRQVVSVRDAWIAPEIIGYRR